LAWTNGQTNLNDFFRSILTDITLSFRKGNNRLLNENPMFNMIKETKSFMKHFYDDVYLLLASFLSVVVMIISLSLLQGIRRTMIPTSANIWNQPESSGICPADTGTIRKFLVRKTASMKSLEFIPGTYRFLILLSKLGKIMKSMTLNQKLKNME
jgi:hypothetical protein